MNLTIRPKRIKNFQRQILELCTSKSDSLGFDTDVIVCARQLGKSWALRLLCLVLANDPGTEICYITTSQRLCRKFLSLFSSILGKTDVECRVGDLSIRFPNGSFIEFFSYESGDRLRGNTYSYVIIDECAFIRSDIDGQNFFYDIVLPTLDDHGKHLILVSTPHGTANFFYDMYVMSESKGRLIKAAVTDDETKTKEWIESKRSMVPDATFRQEYMCEFMSSGFGVINNVYADSFTIGGINHRGRFVIGVDPAAGSNDDCAITVIDTDTLNTYQHSFNLGRQDVMEVARRTADYIKPFLPNTRRIVVEDNNPVDFYKTLQSCLPLQYRSLVSGVKMTLQYKNAIIGKLNSVIGDMRFEMKNTKLKKQLDNFICLSYAKDGLMQMGNSSDSIHDDCVISLAIATDAAIDLLNKPRGNNLFVL